jgi:NADPH-dependent curcumin reductase CurA
MKTREVRLARLPKGAPRADDFAVATVELPEPSDGDVVVRNLAMSVDPYMRLPLTGLAGVHAPMKVGDAMDGAAVGQVVQSRNKAFPVGTHVAHPMMGWREAYLSNGTGLTPVDPALAPPSYFLGILGMTGITAFAGVEHVLKPKTGEVLFVSGAAGAVGSLVCQLAALRGALVVGSTGSKDKARWLKDTLKLAHVINYRTEKLVEALQHAAPAGLDAYFDNVGGSTLEAAIAAIKTSGRIALCGAIELYNEVNYRAGPQNFFSVIEKGLTLTGVNVGHYYAHAPQIIAELASLINSGKLIWRETVVDGIENAPAAFVSMLDGGNTGKMIVRLWGG